MLSTEPVRSCMRYSYLVLFISGARLLKLFEDWCLPDPQPGYQWHKNIFLKLHTVFFFPSERSNAADKEWRCHSLSAAFGPRKWASDFRKNKKKNKGAEKSVVWAVMCVFKRSSASLLYPPLFFQPVFWVTWLCRRRCLVFIQTLSRPPLTLRTEERLWKSLKWGRHWWFTLKCRCVSIPTMWLTVKAPVVKHRNRARRPTCSPLVPAAFCWVAVKGLYVCSKGNIQLCTRTVCARLSYPHLERLVKE